MEKQGRSKLLKVIFLITIILIIFIVFLKVWKGDIKTSVSEISYIFNQSNINEVAGDEDVETVSRADITVNENLFVPDMSYTTEIFDNDHIRGNPDAEITIVEWSDFQCPFCQRFRNTINDLLDEYGNDIRTVYRHFPLDSIHPYARKAAEASECAGDQDKFWEFYDAMYENQNMIQANGIKFLEKTIRKMGLDEDEFNSCLNSGKYADLVDKHLTMGVLSGVNSTPGNFINGRSIGGAVPYETLKIQIDLMLKIK